MLTFTTDFGTKAPYIAEMKGSVYEINPNIDIIDVTHKVKRHNIFEASFVMHELQKWYSNSVHVCVVDPGVGSSRDAIIVKSDDQYFVGPDNGVFSFLSSDNILKIKERDLKKILGRRISNTFHGRDIFAPAGAFLEIGYDPLKFSSPKEQMNRLDLEPKKDGNLVYGKVIFIDDFGNIITNIDPDDDFSEVLFRSEDGEDRILDFVKTYSDVEKDDLISLKGSHGFLEISANQGNASNILGVSSGENISIELR